MSGNCYKCATAFSFMKKEHGCKNCGFAFCKNCITKKAPVPKCGNEKHKVCDKCFNILSGKPEPQLPVEYSPPEAYKKRIAALESRGHEEKSATTSSKRTAGCHSNTRGLSAADRDIASRLEKLKEGKPAVPHEDEIRKRLGRLRGEDPEKASQPVVFKPDRRSEQTQIDDLLEEICNEVEIDSHTIDAATDVQNRLDHSKDAEHPTSDVENNLNKTDENLKPSYSKNIPTVGADCEAASAEAVNNQEINNLISEVASELKLDAKRAEAGLRKDKELWERLNRLKKRERKEGENTEKAETRENENVTSETPGSRTSTSDNECDSESEEEAIKQILRQALVAESTSNDKDEVGVPEDDELPWCCICNEDAVLRCFGCDGDLYCRRCFREGHDKFDMEDHETTSFKPRST